MSLQQIDVGHIVSERLSALRKLQSNPGDVQALGCVYKSQQKVYIVYNWDTIDFHDFANFLFNLLICFHFDYCNLLICWGNLVHSCLNSG